MIIYGITLIVLGLLASPSLLLSKKPNAKELLDKLVPYQGWAGVVFAFWGIWGIIDCILHLSMLSEGVWSIVIWIFCLLLSVTEACLGFILGYGLIAKYVLSKNPTAAEKGEQLLAKLTPLQGKLGLLGVILGIVYIILYVIVF